MSGPEQSAGRARRAVAAAVVAVAVLAAPTAHGLHVVNGSFDIASMATTGLLFALLGALVMVRQPSNAIGVVLATIGVASVLGALSEAVTTVTYGTERLQVPGAVWAAWLSEWYWIPAIGLQFVAIPLLFPNGRPHGAGWRRYAVVAAVVGCVFVLLAAGGQDLVLEGTTLGQSLESGVTLVLDNPAGILPLGNFERDIGLLVVLLPLFAIGAAVSLVQRFRAATGEVRDQLKVAVTGIAVAAVGFAVIAAFGTSRSPVLSVLELPLLFLIPVTLGVAILRYRLYEIDRVISRALAYAIISVVLAGTYLGLVVVLGSVARAVTGEAGDLVVALSTLAVAALFQPLRHRVQELVDSRFNRSRYDAARTVEDFGRGLRDEVRADAVIARLRGTVAASVDPASVGVVVLRPVEEVTR